MSIIYKLAVIALLWIALSACDGKQGEGSNQPDPTPVPQPTITAMPSHDSPVRNGAKVVCPDPKKCTRIP